MDTRKVTLVATIAVIALLAVGIGYAYTAATENSSNDVELKYLTMVPTKVSGSTSYTQDFDGKNLKYDSVTRMGTSDDGNTYNGHDIVVYTLASDAFDSKFGSEQSNTALKVGEIYLQIDEKNTKDANDTYTVNIKATDATATGINTDKFKFGVSFEAKYFSNATKPLSGEQLAAIETWDSGTPATVAGLTNYTGETGATSTSYTTHTAGFNVIKVTFYLTGLDNTIANQMFLLSALYPNEGNPAAPLQPMTGVTFKFEAVATEVANA